MGKFTQIPQNTFETLQIEAGVISREFNPDTAELDKENIICATTGGITVAATPTFSDYGSDVDNCPNNMMELKHLDSWEVSIQFTSLGTSPELLAMALGCADVNGNKVTPRASLKQSDFKSIWWVGDKANGGMVAAHLFNALSTSGLSLKTTKAGKGQISVTMTGHVSIDAQDVVPIEFYSADPPVEGGAASAAAYTGGNEYKENEEESDEEIA